MTLEPKNKPKRKIPIEKFVRRMRRALITVAKNPDRKMRPEALKVLARKLVKQEGRSL